MALVVQKFGGTSVGSIDRMRNVARRAIAAQKEGHKVVLIVSAMSGETNRLLALAHDVTKVPDAREMDVIAATGEQVSAALVALAIQSEGGKARSLLGHQVKITTDDAFTKARIKTIEGSKIFSTVEQGEIAVVAGFQGVDDEGNITTLGRGGSDTTAVALAAAMQASVCEIYTDVDGVFTADPRIVPKARKVDRITNEEMLELAASGSKVLHLRSVEYARRFNIPIHVRSSFSHKEGTFVTDQPAPEGESVEAPIIAGVAHDRSEAKITVVGVPDRTGMAATIFAAIAEAGINIDMIVQNVSATETGLTDISFTLPKTEGPAAMQALHNIQDEVGFASLQFDDQIGKLSLVGAGMRSNPGVSATFFKAIADVGVNVEMISTSEIRISVVTRDDRLDDAVLAVHSAFGLDADEAAVVYGGTGR